MSKECENRYKLCRVNAGFTQEQAAELLGVAPRTLCDYENGHSKVPDEIVATMADIYKSRILVWWHIKYNSPLGKFMPDVVMPQSKEDMAFQLIIAQDDLVPSVTTVKQIVAGGEICEEKSKTLEQAIEVIRQVKAKLLSAVIYAGKIGNE